MSIPIPDFWRLLVESRLASPEQARQLRELFANVKGGEASSANAAALAQWMISNGLLSLYQAKVLLSGRAGPFVFGDYLLYDRFEAGRFKSIFKAVHLPTRQRVLVAFHTGPLAQIQREWLNVVEQTARFRHAVHPHLSRVLELIDLGQYKFTVLEDLEGHSALERLADGPIPWREACKMGQQLAAGLSRLAELKLLHGEICPANVWIDPAGNAKLLLPPLAHDPSMVPGPIDFLQPDPSGRLLMLADYTAPELGQPSQVGHKGSGPNWQSEIYALGCTLFHLMAGRPPFTGDDVSAKLMQHATAEPVAPLETFGVPPWVAQVVSQMMDKDVTRRYQNPLQVVAALGALLQPSAAAAPPDAIAPLAPLAPELPPSQLLPPLDLSRNALPPAEAPAGQAPIDFPTAEIGPDNFGFFDAIAVPPGRTRRAPKNNGLQFAVVALLLCMIGGLIFLAASLLNKPDKSKPDAASESVAKSPADADQAKASDESETNNAESNEASTSAATGSENAVLPNAVAAPAHADDKGPSQLAGDDRALLWISPTRGPPISVNYVPPGAQAFLFLRPAELLRLSEGEKLLAALGPFGETARQQLESIAGAPLSEIEQLTIAWVERVSGQSASSVEPFYVFSFAKPLDPDKLKAQWNSAAPTTHGGETVYTTSSGAAYLPSAQRGKVLIAGAAQEVEESANQGSVAPPLRIAVEKMLLASDANRQFVFLFAPGFLYQQSGYFFAGELKSLLPPLRGFLPDDYRAAMLSAHLTKDNLFIELCALGPIGHSPESVAKQFRDALTKLPQAVEAAVASLAPQPYSKQVLERYPLMIRALAEFMRTGTQDAQAVMRCYLPAQAAHNLLIGSELALAEAAGSAAGNGVGSAQRETVAQKLQHVTSLVFARETLEKALQLLGDDIGVKIEIMGGDLQLEGITKNQSFGLDEKNKPAIEILRKIMLQANPDGKLVYVAKPRAPGGEEMLFITTRKGAEKRGDKLSPEFAVPKGK